MLSDRERTIACIAGGMAAYSIRASEGRARGTMFDYVLGAVPPDLRGAVTAELIDEVFSTVKLHKG